MEKAGMAVKRILPYLPVSIAEATKVFLASLPKEEDADWISELRLRADAPFSLTFRQRSICRFGGALFLCREDEILATLQHLCEDSLHSFEETLREGYVAFENGYRVGVCGYAGAGSEHIRGVYGIRSLCIRIPHPVAGVCAEALSYITAGETLCSALFYSPPNVGKTTMIRDLAASLSSGSHPRRVVVVDTRGEIYMREMFCTSLADFLRGYPRAKGIEIATRVLSPEVIICDEIGGRDEAEAILSAQNSGVPLVATAHAGSLTALLRRPPLRVLLENGVFQVAIGLSRKDGGKRFLLDVCENPIASVCAAREDAR